MSSYTDWACVIATQSTWCHKISPICSPQSELWRFKHSQAAPLFIRAIIMIKTIYPDHQHWTNTQLRLTAHMSSWTRGLQSWDTNWWMTHRYIYVHINAVWDIQNYFSVSLSFICFIQISATFSCKSYFNWFPILICSVDLPGLKLLYLLLMLSLKSNMKNNNSQYGGKDSLCTQKWRGAVLRCWLDE